MAIPTILAAVLAVQSTPEFDFSAQPNLCASDPAVVVRPARKGSTARYVFQLPAELTPAISAFLDGLAPERFLVTLRLQTDRFSLVFIETRIPVRTTEQVFGEVATLCRIDTHSPARLALFERIDAVSRAKLARARRREARQRAAATRESIDFLRRQPMDRRDIEEILKHDAEARGTFFGPNLTGLKLGQLHKVDCVRSKKDKYVQNCKIGLPILRDGEPQYVEFYADFTRDSAGKAFHVSEEIVIID